MHHQQLQKYDVIRKGQEKITNYQALQIIFSFFNLICQRQAKRRCQLALNLICLQAMKGYNNNEAQKIKSEQPQMRGVQPKAGSQQRPDPIVHYQKQAEDQIYKQSDKIIKNSSSYKNSLLSRLQPSKADAQSHKVTKSIRDYRQQLTFLRESSGQFIAYCVITKESKTGVLSNERLLVLDSRFRTLQYYSHMPQLPIRAIEDINEHPKQQINMTNSQKFTITQLKNAIGEVEISAVQSGKIKKWKFKMGNSHLAREFCLIVNNVKDGKYLQQRIEVSPPRAPQEIKVNSKKTNFINEVSRLEQKRESNKVSLNQSLISKIQPAKREEVSENDILVNQIILETEPKQESPIPEQKPEQQQSPYKIQIPQIIAKPSTDYLSAPLPFTLQAKQSVHSIKIEEIIKQVVENQTAKKEQPLVSLIVPLTPTVNELTSIQLVQPSPRNSEISRILKNRRTLEPQQQDSIATIKHQNRQKQLLGMSKLLVKNMHRRPTNKQDFQRSQQKQKASLQMYYRTEQPEKLNTYRENLLVQRRMSEVPAKSSQRRTYIINQHNHPRQQKSRSRSKDRDNSLSGLIERQWLLKWVNASTTQQRAQTYCKFVQHCRARVEKLAGSFDNWHIFHKQPEEYVIKQQGIEYTYHMLKKNDSQDLAIIQEQEMLQKMKNLDYIWKTINSQGNKSSRYAVPLACVINYKCLKVFCKVQLASDSLLIEEIHQASGLNTQVKVLEQALRGSLRYSSLFWVTSNQTKCLYIHEADILPMLHLQRGYTLTHSYLHKEIKDPKQNDEDKILGHITNKLIPSFMDALGQAQIMSTLDLGRLLESYCLNISLMPLIYEKIIQADCKKVRRLIISQMCVSLLENLVRQQMHSLLMKKQSNKSINSEIFHIIAKVLRWNNKEYHLTQRFNKKFGINLQGIANELIEEYIVGSLLIKLSLNCHLNIEFPFEKYQQQGFSFWRECEFDQETMKLTFAPQVTTYDHRFLDKRSTQLQQILQRGPLISQQDFHIIKDILKNGQNNYKSSALYKLLPLVTKSKIDCYQQHLRKMSNDQLFNDSSVISQTNSYYLTNQVFQVVFITIKQLVEARRVGQAQNLIKTELTRAWTWCKNLPHPLISLYDLYSLLKLKSKLPEALAECLRSLQLSIDYYETGDVSSGFLMEKTFKAAHLHQINGSFSKALQLYHTCAQIFDKMMHLSEVDYNTLIKYMSIFRCSAGILMQQGRTEEAAKAAIYSLDRCRQWEEGLKQLKRDFVDKILQEKLQIYFFLLRCYELLGKRMEILQQVEYISIMYIQAIISKIDDTKLKPSTLTQQRFKDILKVIWLALVLNCSVRKVSYHHYFSKAYSRLKLVQVSSITSIIYAIQEQCKGNTPLPLTQAIQKLLAYLLARMPQNKLEKLCNEGSAMESYLVEACLQCLCVLSSSNFLDDSEQQIDCNSKQLQILSWIVSICGYEYTLGAINDNFLF